MEQFAWTFLCLSLPSGQIDHGSSYTSIRVFISGSLIDHTIGFGDSILFAQNLGQKCWNSTIRLIWTVDGRAGSSDFVFFIQYINKDSRARDYTRWNLPEGALVRLGKGEVGSVSWSPDGTRLAVASSIGIWLYDVRNGTEDALPSGHTGSIYSLSFSHDGNILASGGDDNTIRLWDVASGREKATLEGPGDSRGCPFRVVLAGWNDRGRRGVLTTIRSGCGTWQAAARRPGWWAI